MQPAGPAGPTVCLVDVTQASEEGPRKGKPSAFPIETFTFCYFLITFLLKSLLSDHFSVEISTFCHLLITFLLKSLLSVFLITFLLKPIELSIFYHGFPIENSTFFHFLIAFLLKSLLSDHFSIEIFTLR